MILSLEPTKDLCSAALHFRLKFFSKSAKMAGNNDMPELIVCLSLCEEHSLALSEVLHVKVGM